MIERYRSVKAGLVYRVIAEPTDWNNGDRLVVIQSEANGDVYSLDAADLYYGDEFVRHATLDDLASTHRYALLAFKDEHGPEWKEKLNLAWQTGKYRGMFAPLLQQIRNNLGPTWLDALVI